MNLNHLKAFVKVIQTGSFKEAARQLDVSQPAITQRLQTLEDYFKTRLLTKDLDGMKLTSHGKTLYDRSLVILSMWDKLEQEMCGSRVSGRLVLGASTIPSEYILPPLLKAFRMQYPEVKLQLRIAGTTEVMKWLRDYTLDIAITGEPYTTPDIHTFPLMTDTMKIIVPVDSFFGQHSSIHELVTTGDWIMREAESDSRRAFENALLSRGYQLKQLQVACQLESTEAVIAAVEAGIGIASVSSMAAERAEKLGRVRVLNIPGLTIDRKFYCSYPKEQEQQSVISSFLSFIKKEA